MGNNCDIGNVDSAGRGVTEGGKDIQYEWLLFGRASLHGRSDCPVKGYQGNSLSGLCKKSEKSIVIIIDEVDSAANNQVFLDFLAQFRYYYLKRTRIPTFQSVILAGVYDIRSMRSKIRPDQEHSNTVLDPRSCIGNCKENTMHNKNIEQVGLYVRRMSGR